MPAVHLALMASVNSMKKQQLLGYVLVDKAL